MINPNSTAQLINFLTSQSAAVGGGGGGSSGCGTGASGSCLLNGITIPRNGRNNEWLQLEVCREFQRGRCTRSAEECKFAHPPSDVELADGRVTCCYDFIKNKCNRVKPPCKYLHPPEHLKVQLIENGKQNLLKQKVESATLSPQLLQLITMRPTLLQNPSATARNPQFTLQGVTPHLAVVNPYLTAGGAIAPQFLGQVMHPTTVAAPHFASSTPSPFIPLLNSSSTEQQQHQAARIVKQQLESGQKQKQQRYSNLVVASSTDQDHNTSSSMGDSTLSSELTASSPNQSISLGSITGTSTSGLSDSCATRKRKAEEAGLIMSSATTTDASADAALRFFQPQQQSQSTQSVATGMNGQQQQLLLKVAALAQQQQQQQQSTQVGTASPYILQQTPQAIVGSTSGLYNVNNLNYFNSANLLAAAQVAKRPHLALNNSSSLSGTGNSVALDLNSQLSAVASFYNSANMQHQHQQQFSNSGQTGVTLTSIPFLSPTNSLSSTNGAGVMSLAGALQPTNPSLATATLQLNHFSTFPSPNIAGNSMQPF